MTSIKTKDRDGINLTVSSRTNTIQLGDSIYSNVNNGIKIYLTSAGAYATNQTVKALAYARGKLLQKGTNIVWYSHFEEVVGKKDNEQITIMHTVILKVDEEGKLNGI